MASTTKWVAAFWVLCLGASCSTMTSTQLAPDEVPLPNHPVLHEAYWSGRCRTPEANPLRAASPELIDFAKEFAHAHGYPGHPKMLAKTLETAVKDQKAIQEALGQIPAKLFELAGEKFCGFHLARDLGVTALGVVVFGSDGKSAGGFVLVDVDRGLKTANEWRTEHENFFFDVSDGALKGRISRNETDSRTAAWRWILIHELGHVIVGQGRDAVELRGGKRRFDSISWIRRDRKFVSKFESSLPFRDQLENVKMGARLFEGDQAFEYYTKLQKTDFPTLYAAANPSEDFSESLAAYVNVFLFHEPVKVLHAKNEVEKTWFTSCFTLGTCKEKIRFLEKLLGLPKKEKQ